MRPCVLFSSAGRKLRILYYLLFFISYFNSLLLVLAVVAGLGADVNIIAGQMGAQAHILALVADSQAQLVVGHGHAAALGLAGQQFDLDDLGRGQGRGDKLGDVLAPADDIDLLAVQLLDDLLDADTAGTDAGTDGIDIGVLAPDSQLGAGTGLTGDGLDLNGTVIDLDRKSVV